MSNEQRDKVKEMLERFRIKIDGIPTNDLTLAGDKLVDEILKYGKEKFDDGFHLGYQRGSGQ